MVNRVASGFLLCVPCILIGILGQSSKAKEMPLASDERLKAVLSKIAPLEQWNFSWSSDGAPRVCWKFFRPDPVQYADLIQIVKGFHGKANWDLVDGRCLEPSTGNTARAPFDFNQLPTPQLTHHISINRSDALSDLPNLADEIETRLNLARAEHLGFSEFLLTREGLRQSRGPFQDFEDGGQRVAYLIVEPTASEVLEPKKTDIMLHFEPMGDEMTAIFVDIAGIDVTQKNSRALTEQEAENIEKRFPILWKLSEYYEDSYLSPQEAVVLSGECTALEKIIFAPKALRGLDKLSRIANWAAKKHYAVLFSAP